MTESFPYEDMPAEELQRKRAEVDAGIAELQPAVERLKELESKWHDIELADDKAAVLSGNPTAKQLAHIRLMAGAYPSLHHAFSVWLGKVTTSGLVTVSPDEPNSHGSSDFYSVPFTVNLNEGVTPELLRDIEITASAINQNRKRLEAVYRVNMDLNILVKIVEGKLSAALSSAYWELSDDEWLGLEEALTEARKRVQKETKTKQRFWRRGR